VIVSWLVAAGVLVTLAIAVIRYLADRDAVASGAMHMHVSTALYRGGGADANLREPLMSTAFFTAWQLDAVAVAVVVVAAAAYLSAVCLVPLRSDGRRWPIARTASFLAGLLVCVFATCGSIAVYDQVLFSAHMLGHLALVMLAPVLLVAGRPLRLTLLAARPATRLRLQRGLQGRVASLVFAAPIALAAYAVAIVGTHLTGLMDQIMKVTWAGQLEHLLYLVVGCVFFALVVGDEPIRWRLSAPARWLLLALAMAVDTFTGVILLQASTPIAMLPAEFRVDGLGDTHTGGAIMWVGGDAIMAMVMVALVVGWLYRPDQRQADGDGFGERARRATFAEHTGVSAATVEASDMDDGDAARVAYNEWLANLAKH
jgi:cytochrome c oxidase assembly factor CtaG